MDRPNRWAWAGLVTLVVVGCAYGAPTGAARRQIPVLNWTARSDWVNVKDLGALGDGMADDTAAIQKAFGAVKVGTTVYLPAGTYRITDTLKITGPISGVSVLGHGRETTLVWDGAEGASHCPRP